ncbi:inositol 2-dehydrogenase [Arthrobacter sp. NPDC056691]|uniref:inositol 2-dehydrogenase n=1 Tax=Arthrobacter sp. NPDC056691 TaxID=3345913 RepID=UPI00366EF76C
MQEKLRVALFGAGRIGQIHGRNIAAHPGLELVAVCDPFGDAAEKLAASIGGLATTDTSKAFAQDLDAVVIGTPNSTHIDLMLQASEKGLAVLCEKPIDLSLDRVRSAWQQLQTSQAPLMLGFNRRYDPNFAAVHSRTQAGEIGRLEQLTITSRDPAPSPKEYVATSGGIFRDMTIHDFDMARFFVPDIVEVHAYGGNAFSDYTKELGDFDQAVVTLRGAGDELVTIINSRHSAYGYDQRVEAFGSEGMLQAGNVLPTTVQCSTGRGTGQGDPNLNFFLERYADAYRAELDAFVDFVISGVEPSPSYLDGMRALELAVAAAESAKTGRSVGIEWGANVRA